MAARIPFRFSGSNPHAQRVAARQAAALVTRITAETMHALRALVMRAIREGIPPYDAARMIRSMVGLTAQQAQAAMNYRAELIDSGLTLERVNVFADRYAEKLLRGRAETIARTEIMDALNEGAEESWRQAQQEGLLGEGAKKEWLVTPDDLLCPICAPMEGRQVPIDEDFPVDGPPAHPNCLPGDALVAACGRVAAQSERRYDGDLLVIHTALGHKLACTPNHPVLAPEGWLPARAFHVGGHVISSPLREWESARRHMDNEDVPARFHDLAETARRSQQMTAAPVPLAAEDFHGDGIGSQVAVVWTDRLLGDGLNPAGRQHARESLFSRARVELAGLSRNGSRRSDARRVGLSTARAVCSRHLARTSSARHAIPFDSLRVAPAAGGDAALPQTAVDDRARDAKLFRELLHGRAGRVAADQVVAIDSLSFQGVVHNMETSSGAYWANGILTHNCRCTVAPVP